MVICPANDNGLNSAVFGFFTDNILLTLRSSLLCKSFWRNCSSICATLCCHSKQRSGGVDTDNDGIAKNKEGQEAQRSLVKTLDGSYVSLIANFRAFCNNIPPCGSIDPDAWFLAFRVSGFRFLSREVFRYLKPRPGSFYPARLLSISREARKSWKEGSLCFH